MLYASSKDRFKRELDGIQVELQATDPSEMSFDIIKARALWIHPTKIIIIIIKENYFFSFQPKTLFIFFSPYIILFYNQASILSPCLSKFTLVIYYIFIMYVVYYVK